MDTPRQPADGATGELLAGAVWHKSSYSGTNGNCVEVATNLPSWVAVRDSKDPDGARLIFGVEQWQGFVQGLRARLA